MNDPEIFQRRDFLSGVAAVSLLGLAGCGGGGDGDNMTSGTNMGGGSGSPPAGVVSGGALRLPANFSGNTLRIRVKIKYPIISGARETECSSSHREIHRV